MRKNQILSFFVGGGSYVALELLWRGRSHSSMFVAGGCCFLLLGQLKTRLKNSPLLLRGMAGAAAITAVELATGFLCNRNYKVWDYRNTPLNFKGQICLPYFLLWIPLSLVGMELFSALQRRISGAQDRELPKEREEDKICAIVVPTHKKGCII